MIRILTFIIVLTLLSLTGRSQEADQYLEDFLAVQQGENVFLRWTIKAGYTCDGTRIQRSESAAGFEKIGEIPGVCGSPDASITYDFRDTVPNYNKMSYYRLEMGVLGFSSPVFVEVIKLNDEGYSVNPNPVVDVSEILFDNPDNESHEVCLINTKGEIVYNVVTSSNRVQIERSLLPGGTYIFKILKGNELKARGKIVVI